MVTRMLPGAKMRTVNPATVVVAFLPPQPPDATPPTGHRLPPASRNRWPPASRNQLPQLLDNAYLIVIFCSGVCCLAARKTKNKINLVAAVYDNPHAFR